MHIFQFCLKKVDMLFVVVICIHRMNKYQLKLQMEELLFSLYESYIENNDQESCLRLIVNNK